MDSWLHAVALGKDDGHVLRVQLTELKPLAAKGQLAFNLMLVIERTVASTDSNVVPVNQCVLFIEISPSRINRRFLLWLTRAVHRDRLLQCLPLSIGCLA
ncbi:hypothetical protein D3C76_1243760 [compost metagenome]